MHPSQELIVQDYQSRIDAIEITLSDLKRTSSRYSYIRLLAVVLLMALIYVLIPYGTIVISVGVIGSIALFLFAMSKQADADAEIDRQDRMLRVVKNEAQSVKRVSNQYYTGEQFYSEKHEFTSDLDVFGKHSIYHWVCRATSFAGIRLLASILRDPQDKAGILERQDAALELEPMIDWRLSFMTSLADVKDGATIDPAVSIKDALDIDLSPVTSSLMRVLTKAMPFVWLGLLAAYYFGVEGTSSIAGILFLLNLGIVGSKGKLTGLVQNQLARTITHLSGFAEAIELMLSNPWKAKSIQRSIDSMGSDPKSQAKSIRGLQELSAKLDYRLNLLVGVTVNGFFLWDIRVMQKLSIWKTKYEDHLYQIINAVGTMEVYTSIATWNYNHPQHSTPEINDEYLTLQMTVGSHPLIAYEQNVANDFTSDQSQHITIITGSNMSGKSTFLRTVGANMVLGYLGANVSAKRMSFPVVQLITYMRIKDQLEENVSTFKAELNRISMIIDKVQEEQCLVLVDEMLRGTNSKDKLKGSMAITQKLHDLKTYAMIATHDIKLAEAGQEQDGVTNYYFDIDYADDELVFDYKIKAGVCQTFNASFLLRKLGIET